MGRSINLAIPREAAIGWDEGVASEVERSDYDSPWKEAVELFRLMDWVLPLPAGLDITFRREVEIFEESLRMRYITSIERLGREEGIIQGRQEGRQEGLEAGRLAARRESVREVLEARFGSLSPEDLLKIESVGDPEILRHWHRLAISASSAREFWSATGVES